MKKILIVSEIDIITKSIKSYLEGEGHEVIQLSKVSEAMEKIFITKFDLLICSVFLDGIDGVQFVSTIKRSFTINSEIITCMITSGGNIGELFPQRMCPEIILKKDKDTLKEFMRFFKSLEKKESCALIDLLYIDDDPFIQKIIASWFAKVPGFRLELCGSISELQKFLGKKYDIIVSDNLLKDGNINNVLQSLADSNLQKVPLIVYTGTVDNLNLSDLKQKGNVIDILPKPFEMKTFMKKIESLKLGKT